MQRWIPVLLAVAGIACHQGSPTPAPRERDAPTAAPARAAPATARVSDLEGRRVAEASSDGLNEIPLGACVPDNYVQFVNAFAQFTGQRARFATARGQAQLRAFDVALVDYRWQRGKDGTALEVEINRRGARLDVSATPVERDGDDNPVRTLGETRHFVFEHGEGCWRYAGLR